MNIEEFWKLIDAAREASGGDVSKQADLLVEILVNRPVEEIYAFDTLWDDVMDNAYDAALWDAAYIIGCGCSNDGFMDFRGWLIAQGKEVYENALTNPESLVDLLSIDEDATEEKMLYVAMTAYEKKTGHEIPIRDTKRIHPHQVLKGKHWAGEIRKERFPRLAAKFGDCDQRWRKWMAKDFPKHSG